MVSLVVIWEPLVPRFVLPRREGRWIWSYHRSAERLREILRRAPKAALGALAGVTLLACGGCAGMGITDDDQIVTGSITPRPAAIPVSAAPDQSGGPGLPVGAAPAGIAAGDWLEAKRALHLALASTEKDASIPWESKASGVSGTATPIGPDKAGGCRDFMISFVSATVADRWVQGTACRGRDSTVLSQVRMLGRA